MLCVTLVFMVLLAFAIRHETDARRRLAVASRMSWHGEHDLVAAVRRGRGCPRCGYDLTGASSILCAECGLNLAWFAKETVRRARFGGVRRSLIVLVGLVPSATLLAHLFRTPLGYTWEELSLLAVIAFALPTVPGAILWWLLLRASDRARSPVVASWGAVWLLLAACAWPFTYYLFRGWD
jgi:hypothetical protein